MLNSSIDITTVTSQNLKERWFETQFPEYYALETVVENSLWHDHQPVLDHVIAVFAGLETVLTFPQLNQSQKSYLEEYLNHPIGNHTRVENLKIATLLHDIAKTDTLITAPDGFARAPGHELIGASRVNHFASRFNLNDQDEVRVERIVRYHGLISDILTLSIESKDQEKYLRIFKDTVGDVAIELVLLMHADLLGSDLAKGDKKAYDNRIKLLDWMLAQLAQ